MKLEISDVNSDNSMSDNSNDIEDSSSDTFGILPTFTVNYTFLFFLFYNT